MAKTKLFEAWSFRLQQPAPLTTRNMPGSKSMGFSQYNTSSTAQKSTLHAPTMRALLAYAKLVSATENGQSVDGLGAIGHQALLTASVSIDPPTRRTVWSSTPSPANSMPHRWRTAHRP